MVQSLVSSIILWLLLLISLVILNFIIFNLKNIFLLFSKIKRKTWILLLLIFVIGFVLRFFVVTHMHNLYYDEEAYLDIAKHISSKWNNCLCLYNVDGDCKFCGFSFKSIGYLFILGIFFKLFGVSSLVAFYVSSLFGSLTIMIIFLFSYLLFKKEKIALLSSLVLALFPLHIRWSGSAAAEIVSLFFIITTFLFLFIYFEFRKFKYLILAVLVLIFSMTVKEENLLLLPFFFLFFIVKRFSKKRLYIAIGIILILFIPFVLGNILLQTGTTIEDSYAGSRYTFWKQGKILSFEFFINNIFRNFLFFVNISYSMVIVILFFFIGLYYLWRYNKRLWIILFLWLFSITALFSAFFEDPLNFSEVRHYMPALLSIILFSSFGMYYFSKIKFIQKIKGLYIIVGILLLSVLFYMPYITLDKSPVVQAQQDHDFLVSHLSDIPKDCLVLTPESYVLDLYDKSSLSLYLLDRFQFSSKCNYYYESEICYRESFKICNATRNSFDLELVASNGRHSFFKIK